MMGAMSRLGRASLGELPTDDLKIADAAHGHVGRNEAGRLRWHSTAQNVDSGHSFTSFCRQGDGIRSFCGAPITKLGGKMERPNDSTRGTWT